MGTFREHSKRAFTEEKASHDGIRTGSLQRIADACEIMASDRQQLLKDLDYYKHLAENRMQIIYDRDREIKSLKSARTRYRNQVKSLTEKLT